VSIERGQPYGEYYPSRFVTRPLLSPNLSALTLIRSHTLKSRFDSGVSFFVRVAQSRGRGLAASCNPRKTTGDPTTSRPARAPPAAGPRRLAASLRFDHTGLNIQRVKPSISRSGTQVSRYENNSRGAKLLRSHDSPMGGRTCSSSPARGDLLPNALAVEREGTGRPTE
jgi:hypothetical protein